MIRFTTALACLGMLWTATATAATYDVGPGQTYENILDVPLGSLGPGDVFEIHWQRDGSLAVRPRRSAAKAT